MSVFDESFDEFFSIQMQQADNQIKGLKAAYIGYIVAYDPIKNLVTVTNEIDGSIPSGTQQADPNSSPTGTPLISAPMPLCTLFAGVSNSANNINPGVVPGVVLAPIGGASKITPTKGEQVLVININAEIGYSAAAFMLFTDTAVSPAKSVPISNVPLKPGEWLAVNPSGTYMHIRNDGTTNIGTIKPPSAGSGGNMNLAIAGNLHATIGSAYSVTATTTAALISGGAMAFDAGADIDITSDTDINERAININRIASGNITDEALNIELVSTRDTSVNAGRNIIFAGVENVSALANNGNVQLIAGQDILQQAVRDIQLVSLTGRITFTAFTDIYMTATNGVMTLTGHDDVLVHSTSGSVGLLAGDNATTAALQNIAISAPRGNILFQTANGQPMTFNAGGSVINNVTNNYTTVTTGGGPTGVGANVVSRSQGNNVINSGGIVSIPSEGDREIRIAGWGDVNILAGQGNVADIGILRLGCPNDIHINAGFGANTKLLDLSATGTVAIFGIEGYQLGTTAYGGIEQGVGTTNGTLEIRSRIDSGGGTPGTGNIDLNAANDILSTATRDIISTASNDNYLIATRNVQLTAAANVQLQAAVNLVMSALGTANILAPTTAIGDSSGHTALSLLTTAFLSAFNSHTHSGVTAGGANTGPPTSTASAGYPTSTNALLAN